MSSPESCGTMHRCRVSRGARIARPDDVQSTLPPPNVACIRPLEIWCSRWSIDFFLSPLSSPRPCSDPLPISRSYTHTRACVSLSFAPRTVSVSCVTRTEHGSRGGRKSTLPTISGAKTSLMLLTAASATTTRVTMRMLIRECMCLYRISLAPFFSDIKWTEKKSNRIPQFASHQSPRARPPRRRTNASI